MLFGVFASWVIISSYGYIYLPKGFVSFNQQNQTNYLENQNLNPNLAYTPIIGLFAINFCIHCVIGSMPWMMLSELFPFKSRAIGSSIAGIYCYY